MNGIEKIIAHIQADAEAEVLAIRAQADDKCAEIRADSERRAQAEYWRVVQEGAKETEQRTFRVERTARLESKKSVLAAKQNAVSQAFELAKSKIVSLPELDYVAFLANQAAEAAITGQEQIIMCPDDRARCGAKVVKAANELLAKRGVPGQLSLSEDSRPMSGGLILKQGDIEVNCTVDTLLELSRGELAAQVAEVLFEG